MSCHLSHAVCLCCAVVPCHLSHAVSVAPCSGSQQRGRWRDGAAQLRRRVQHGKQAQAELPHLLRGQVLSASLLRQPQQLQGPLRLRGRRRHIPPAPQPPPPPLPAHLVEDLHVGRGEPAPLRGGGHPGRLPRAAQDCHRGREQASRGVVHRHERQELQHHAGHVQADRPGALLRRGHHPGHVAPLPQLPHPLLRRRPRRRHHEGAPPRPRGSWRRRRRRRGRRKGRYRGQAPSEPRGDDYTGHVQGEERAARGQDAPVRAPSGRPTNLQGLSWRDEPRRVTEDLQCSLLSFVSDRNLPTSAPPYGPRQTKPRKTKSEERDQPLTAKPTERRESRWWWWWWWWRWWWYYWLKW